MEHEAFCPTPLLGSHLPELVEIRHDLHAHPELGFEEVRTGAIVRREVEALGFAAVACAETGLYVDLRPDLVGQGDTVALRADMDCLPMEEHTELSYRSTYPGRAHKCGHDGHTTIMIGVARLLAPQRDLLRRNVRLIFQPAEEGARGGGAKYMVQEGVLNGVAEVYGLHNWPPYPLGTLRVTQGAIMAELCDFVIRVKGVGGHGAQPQDCRDPIVAASALVVAIDGIARQCLGSLGGGVISVGQFNAGDANNVIPEMAILEGSMRFFNSEIAMRMKDAVRRQCEGISKIYDLEIELDLMDSYPLLVNDGLCAEVVREAGRTILGQGAISSEGLPMAGAEDFAYFAQERPSAFFMLGTGREGRENYGCHHPDFDFEDALIETGIRVFCEIVRLRAVNANSVLR